MQARKARARLANKKQLAIPKSTELYLLEKAMKGEERGEQFATLQSIVYNFTNETRGFGYKAGFAIGELAAKHFELHQLQSLFEKIGFGKLLYTPTEHEAIVITSASSSINAGMPMHVFEAGFLAGYFSAKTSRLLGAEETHCMLNNSKCTFIIGAGKTPQGHPIADFSKAAEMIASSIGHKACTSYYLLSFLPILQQPLLSSTAKLTYLLGKRLGYMGLEPEQLAKYLQVDGKMSNNEFEISYPHLLSHSGYVLVSSMLLRGYLQSNFKKRVFLEQHMRKGSYLVKLSLV